MSGKNNLSKRFNPSIETLVAKYLEYRNLVECCEMKGEMTKGNSESIAFCRQKLEEIETALFPANYRIKKIFVAWQLLHRVGEELILLMGREELSAYGLRLDMEIKMSSLPESQKADWSIKITESVKKTSEAGCSTEELTKARHQFKNMHRAVNSIVDDSFWDIWTKKLLAFCYIVLLIGLTSGFLFAMSQNACLTPLKILMLGAIGGLLSGIITGEQETLPKGHFWAPTTYYILARPTLGALAALVTFWMIESQFIVTIDPPLTENVKAFNCISLNKGKFSEQIITAREPSRIEENIPADKLQTEGIREEEKGSTALSIITLKAKSGKQNYLYLLVLLFAGFSGDKLLKTVADRVTTKLITQAEKTKETK